MNCDNAAVEVDVGVAEKGDVIQLGELELTLIGGGVGEVLF